MSLPNRHIKKHIKKRLIAEAGNKCANPGCQNSRVEFHHIELWSIVKTHDESHMIAVCPSCHDACHNGLLVISEDVLYRWKKIQRPTHAVHSLIYAEPTESPRILLGTITFKPSNPGNLTVFELWPNNRLSFTINNTWLQVNATISDSSGKSIASVIDNHLTGNVCMGVELIQRPGKFQLLVPTKKFYLPAEHVIMMRTVSPNYGEGEKITAIDLEVIAPGLIKIQGFWNHGKESVVITDEAISFCRPGLRQPISLVGDGEDTTVVYDGPIGGALFSFDPNSSAALKM
ncbi:MULTISPECIES: HNH endonuclease signature motif containing protein [unclassified Pseudomonas]|uniref:HNH endonuclease signature motif containing protein n=1 Tax=unclassified Pseudomonas TaxID=196821 RepID=UPI000720DF1B|nr:MULTISPECIES: HNH endonuclease signature motif containing protein [unclassified Pseudomonas]TCT96056.1 hypothetical protein EC913_10860 [Pseudomonas sp. LP_4_YM]CRN08023.1 hypothetical protein PYEL_38770 [Pseudomonas sp. URMO17WK12:I11]